MYQQSLHFALQGVSLRAFFLCAGNVITQRSMCSSTNLPKKCGPNQCATVRARWCVIAQHVVCIYAIPRTSRVNSSRSEKVCTYVDRRTCARIFTCIQLYIYTRIRLSAPRINYYSLLPGPPPTRAYKMHSDDIWLVVPETLIDHRSILILFRCELQFDCIV